MNCMLPCSSASGRCTAPCAASGSGRAPMDSISSRSVGSLAGRRLSHSMASTSGRDGTRRRGRSRMQVDAALFEPPPFQPTKLAVEYLPGAAVSSLACIRSSSSSRSVLPHLRRYTLTHNDITGALQLSIGSEYNKQQVQGLYTRILRDEITAEWLFGAAGGAAPAELHIFCHVSGEERWLAPPQLRNFIFRREMTLVLDTFLYADRQLLQAFHDLLRAKVYVHFQSDVQDLDLREYWGVLGNRATWRRMPKGLLARLKLLLFGFPALPHQRPRHALTHQQQQQQQQQEQQQGPIVPAATTAAAAAAVGTVAAVGAVAALEPSSAAAAAAPAVMHAVGEESADSSGGSKSSSSSTVAHQWHPAAELAVEATRPVALSLQEQRQEQQRQQQQQQQHNRQVLASQQQQQQHEQQQAAPPLVHPLAMQGLAPQQQQQPPQQQGGLPLCEGGQQAAGEACNCCNCNESQDQSSTGDTGSLAPPSTAQHQFSDTQQQQEQWQLPSQAQLQQQLGQLEQAAMVEALLEYGRWSTRTPQPTAATAATAAASAATVRELVQVAAVRGGSSSSGGCSGSNVLPAGTLGGPSALQFALQQQQQGQLLARTASCGAVVLATVVDAPNSSSGRF